MVRRRAAARVASRTRPWCSSTTTCSPGYAAGPCVASRASMARLPRRCHPPLTTKLALTDEQQKRQEQERRRTQRMAMHMGLSRDALSSSQKFIKVHSRWARWAAFGHKGQWFGGDEEPPSREAFLRVVAVQNSNSADSASAQKTQLGDAWDPTEGHARAVCDGFRSRGNDRRRSKVLPSHVRFLSADSVVEKASLKVLLHDGFDASVHQNIDNAVDSVAEFSPEVVMEHLQQDADSGSYTTATSHTLALQLNKGSLEEIKAGEAQQQQQHEARLQRRRGFSQAGDAIPGVPGNQDRLPTRVEVHHMSRVDADASVGKPVEVFSKGAGSWVEGYIVSVNTGKQTVQVSYKSATGLEMQKVLQLDSPDWRYPTAAGSVACPLSGVTPRTVSAERLGAQQQAVSAERLSAQQQAEDSRGGFVSALCSQTVIAEADKASLSCEMLIEASAAGEIYLGVAPITRTKSGMPPLEGSLYDRCPGWMAVRIADGGIWSGPGNTMAGEASQLLGDQRWMQAPAPRQEEAGGCTSWMQRWMQAGDGAGGHGGDWEPFAKVGDRIRLEILPHEKQAVVWKNDVEQGRLLLPQLTHAALEDRSLRWMVTMANEGDAASIAFNSEPPSAPERLAVPRPLDAGISYRRLVRNHIESHRCVSCEVIYEVLFMSSSSELKRLGVGTLLVNQLKHMLDGESLGPAISKRSLCVSIKSNSSEALAFWSSMGLSPIDGEEPTDRQIIDVMVPFADFCPVAASWEEEDTRQRRG